MCSSDLLFDEMVTSIRDDTARKLLMVIPRPQELEVKRVDVLKPVSENGVALGGAPKQPLAAKKPVVNKTPKVGRNDPCPCGSGKKYKKCCGAGTADADED